MRIHMRTGLHHSLLGNVAEEVVLATLGVHTYRVAS
jgi:hypothetical protein